MSRLSSNEIFFGTVPGALPSQPAIRKSRAVLHNDGKMLLETINGVLLLPGGKSHPEEDDQDTLTREVREETGLTLPSDADVEYLCDVHNYQGDYPHQDGRTIEHFTSTRYFSVLTDISLRGVVSLTDNEQEGDLQTIEIYEDYVLEYIKNQQTDNPRWSFFERELSAVMQTYLAGKR